MNKKIILTIFVFALIIGGFTVFTAIDTTNDGYYLYNNYVMQVQSPGLCVQISSSGSGNMFLASRTDGELSSLISHLPSGTSATYCYNLPPRVSVWTGKVNTHTDSSGVWQWDSDCSSGSGVNLLTYCRKFNPETYTYSTYGNEMITKWKDSGCGGLYSSYKTTYQCHLCSELGSSNCESNGCDWHPYGWTCGLYNCYNYYDGTSCSNAGCYWNGWSCLTVPSCGYYYDETSCYSDGNCGWDSYNTCCYNPYSGSCSSYYSQYECENYGGYNCQWNWNNYNCHERC